MRRPLCLIGMAFVAVLLLGIFFVPHSARTYEETDAEQVVVLGVVEWKERKISKEEEVLVVSLGQVFVLEPGQTAECRRLLTDQENLPGTFRGNTLKKIRKYSKKEQESLRHPGTEGIEGVLCYLDGEEPAMGSIVLMEGKFYAFTHATNPGEFDAADYYRIMGQQGRLMKAKCLAQSGEFSAFREGLYRCRTYLSLLLRACCPKREADIMAAMLLGEKGALDEEIKNLYQQNGIIHILAISGLHLSLLGMGIYGIGRRLRIPNAVNIIISVALLYCYGSMVGMGVSIIRALIMFGMKLSASLFKRTYDMLTAMMTAALLILVQQPLYLTHSGFLFSFGAICAIGFLPAVSACLPSRYKPVKALAAGLWVAVFTLPVHLCFYYQFPPYSVFLNLLVIPCMGAVLLSGIAAVAAGMLSLSLGHIASLPGAVILIFYEKCCDFCGKLPGRQWIAGCPAQWQIVLFCALIALAVFFAVKKRKREFAAGLLLAVAVLCLRFSMGLEITVLDVGQGDCIYLSEGGNRHYLIDGGSSDKSDVDAYQIVPFLKYRGVSGLDAVFVTHPDSDHENGIRGMLENYEENGIRVGMLVLPDVAEESKNENYLTLQSLAEDREIPVRFVHEGQRIDGDSLTFLCLHPAEGYLCGEANAYSTVLALTYGGFSALFTGDLEGEGESLVMERLAQMQAGTGRILPESFTLLKVAHHGSRNSTPEEFLELTDPRIALISAGRDNSYGHPHRETMERLTGQGCRIYQTPESGAVTIRVRGDRVYVEEYIK